MLTDILGLTRDRQYRRYLLLLLTAGSASSAGIPLVPLYLTSRLEVSLTEMGIIVAAGVLGSVAAVAVGRVSDRLRHRAQLVRGASVWLATGWLLLGVVDGFWQALAVAGLFLSTAGVLSSQIFACLGDTLAYRGETRTSFVTGTLRSGFSLGYVIGPLIGTALAGAAGVRAAFIAAAVGYGLALCLSWTLSGTRPPGTRSATAISRSGGGGTVLLLFCAGVSLVMIGDHLKTTYLPIYIVDILGHAPLASGIIIAGVAALELVAFPVVGRLADRYGIDRILVIALAVGVVDYAILAASTGLALVYVSQVLHVVVIATVYGLGATHAQTLAAGRSGAATGAYFAALNIAKSAAGLIAAGSVASLGLPGMFWLPAVFCAVCLAGSVCLARHRRGTVPDTMLPAAKPHAEAEPAGQPERLAAR